MNNHKPTCEFNDPSVRGCTIYNRNLHTTALATLPIYLTYLLLPIQLIPTYLPYDQHIYLPYDLPIAILT